jgi:hypothetical protein
LRRAISFLISLTAASDVNRPGPGRFESAIRTHVPALYGSGHGRMRELEHSAVETSRFERSPLLVACRHPLKAAELANLACLLTEMNARGSNGALGSARWTERWRSGSYLACEGRVAGSR